MYYNIFFESVVFSDTQLTGRYLNIVQLLLEINSADNPKIETVVIKNGAIALRTIL